MQCTLLLATPGTVLLEMQLPSLFRSIVTLSLQQQPPFPRCGTRLGKFMAQLGSGEPDREEGEGGGEGEAKWIRGIKPMEEK